MYHVSAQGIDERMINAHYYYYYLKRINGNLLGEDGVREVVHVSRKETSADNLDSSLS